MDRILTIIGPTAAGKTEVSLEIAKKICGEIISADSRQIYKYLDIGTAKPTVKERREINFHLIDFVDPDGNYSCGQFRRDAEAKIEEIIKRKNMPIICGGTGLYIKALFNPLHDLPQSDKRLKESLAQLLQKHGIDYLYKKLLTIDPQWAKRIMPNDKQRILRGLEVYKITGKPISQLIKRKNMKAKYQPYYIGLNLPREELYQRIDQRFDLMVKKGLVEEVESLLRRGFDSNSSALRTIGYLEIIEYLKGRLTLDDARTKAKQRTRNFAKRQITWFSKIPDLVWFDPEKSDLAKIIIELFLKSTTCRRAF